MRRSLLFGLTKAFALAFILAASACGPLESLFGGHLNANGARGTIGQERVPDKRYGYFLGGTENDFKTVDIVPLLTGGEVCRADPKADPNDDQCVEWAFSCFHYYLVGQCPQAGFATGGSSSGVELDSDSDPSRAESQRLRRNYVQERLIAASNSSCREFEQNLNSVQSYTNLVLGIASLGTGAAGAVVSAAVAAKALSGVTGALSGTRSEFNNDVFVQQLFPTISQAIDTSREQYLIQLRGSKVEQTGQFTASGVTSPVTGSSPVAKLTASARASSTPRGTPIAVSTPASEKVTTSANIVGKQSLPPSEYPVEAAVADAIFFNDLCSLNKRLQTITKSLQASSDIGLNQFLTDVQKFRQIQQLVQAPNAMSTPVASAGASPVASPTADTGG